MPLSVKREKLLMPKSPENINLQITNSIRPFDFRNSDVMSPRKNSVITKSPRLLKKVPPPIGKLKASNSFRMPKANSPSKSKFLLPSGLNPTNKLLKSSDKRSPLAKSPKDLLKNAIFKEQPIPVTPLLKHRNIVQKLKNELLKNSRKDFLGKLTITQSTIIEAPPITVSPPINEPQSDSPIKDKEPLMSFSMPIPSFSPTLKKHDFLAPPRLQPNISPCFLNPPTPSIGRHSEEEEKSVSGKIPQIDIMPMISIISTSPNKIQKINFIESRPPTIQNEDQKSPVKRKPSLEHQPDSAKTLSDTKKPRRAANKRFSLRIEKDEEIKKPRSQFGLSDKNKAALVSDVLGIQDPIVFFYYW